MKICKICNKEFKPSKYRPGQLVCANAECQKKRQIENERQWRLKNPNYFKSQGQIDSWQKVRHEYNKLWRKAHKSHIKSYEADHKEQRKVYMRDYMRRRRANKGMILQ